MSILDIKIFSFFFSVMQAVYNCPMDFKLIQLSTHLLSCPKFLYRCLNHIDFFICTYIFLHEIIVLSHYFSNDNSSEDECKVKSNALFKMCSNTTFCNIMIYGPPLFLSIFVCLTDFFTFINVNILVYDYDQSRPLIVIREFRVKIVSLFPGYSNYCIITSL